MKEGELVVVQAGEQLQEAAANLAQVVVRYYNELVKAELPPELVMHLTMAYQNDLMVTALGLNNNDG
ncbi:MAG: hypothetical protein ACYSW0_21180 [Planctomycetota bacterium]|jgi:hypothetical protein